MTVQKTSGYYWRIRFLTIFSPQKPCDLADWTASCPQILPNSRWFLVDSPNRPEFANSIPPFDEHL